MLLDVQMYSKMCELLKEYLGSVTKCHQMSLNVIKCP